MSKAADEAFAADAIDTACNEWWAKHQTGICYHSTRREIWRAAWEARGKQDLEAVEAVNVKGNVGSLSYGGIVTATCNEIKNRIKGA